jgi:hypothetical protein
MSPCLSVQGGGVSKEKLLIVLTVFVTGTKGLAKGLATGLVPLTDLDL